MVDFSSFEHLWHEDKEQFWIMIVVALISIIIDTTYGLIIGMFIYLFKFAEKMMEAFSEISLAKENSSKFLQITDEQLNKKNRILKRGLLDNQSPDSVFFENPMVASEDIPPKLLGSKNFILYRFAGVINFMNIMSHEAKIKLLPEFPLVILSLRYVHLLDMEALSSFKGIIERMEKDGKTVFVTGVSDGILYELSKHNREWLNKLVSSGKLYELHHKSK